MRGWKMAEYMYAHQKVLGPNPQCTIGNGCDDTEKFKWDQQVPGLDVNSPYAQPYPMYCVKLNKGI